MFNDKTDIGPNNCWGHVKFDEILGFCCDVVIYIELFAIFPKIFSPFFRLWMNQFAEDEIEDSYRVETVEGLGASIPCEFFDWIFVGLFHKCGERMIGDMAEKDVEEYAKTPAEKYLVVRMNSVVYST